MDESIKTWLKDAKFRLRYIHLPQMFVSFLIAFSFPFFYHYLAIPFYYYLYKDAVAVALEAARITTFILYAALFIWFIISFVWIRLRVLEIYPTSRRFAALLFPVLILLISYVIMYIHFEKENEHLYVIDNIHSIKKSDSTEFYQIKNYHILYEEAKFKSTYNYSPPNRRQGHNLPVNTVRTYVVCPIILNFMTDYQIKTHSLWVGFEFERSVGKESFTDEDIEDLQNRNMLEFNYKSEITYFKETTESLYRDVIKEQFSNKAEPLEVLQAHFDPFEPYNGYGMILALLYIHLGVYLFMFLVLLQYDIDQWEQLKVLKEKNWQL